MGGLKTSTGQYGTISCSAILIATLVKSECSVATVLVRSSANLQVSGQITFGIDAAKEQHMQEVTGLVGQYLLHAMNKLSFSPP